MPASLTRRQALAHALALGGGMALPSVHAAEARGRVLQATRQLPALARQLQRATGVPGLAWAVVHGGQTIAAQGLGVRRLGHPGAVDGDTVFQLASLSKPLGATVVARQVSLGRVDWDSRMHDLLPWFALSDAQATQRLTVGDLYAHRSGLPDHAGDKLQELGYSAFEVMRRLHLLRTAPLGSTYAYTNMGLTAAAQGVAQAAGQDWASLSRTSLYAPLGMARTTSVYEEFTAQHNRAWGHVRTPDGGWAEGLPFNANAQSPAGGASSSVRDMARWLALLLARGRWQGRNLIATTALQPLWEPQAPGGHYGYGFNLGATEAGLEFIGHSGAFMLGAATAFTLVPALDAAIVVLTNGIPLGVPETLCRQFVDLAAEGRLTQDWWPRYSQAIAPLMAPEGRLLGQQPPALPAPAGALARYTGRYHNPYYGTLAVEQAQDGLQLTLGPVRQRYRLQHWDGPRFSFAPALESAPPGSLSQATFTLAPDGTAPAQRLWLEYYDDEGWGTFERV